MMGTVSIDTIYQDQNEESLEPQASSYHFVWLIQYLDIYKIIFQTHIHMEK